MRRRDVIRTLGLALATVATTGRASAASASGSGLFCLDTAEGTYRDAAIRNYKWVRGYAWRGLTWATGEPSRDHYDFDAVRHILSRLPFRQVLSMNLTEITGAWPAYLAQDAAQTWVYTAVQGPMKGIPVTMPVPWDLETQARWRRFLRKLANYTGAGGRLRDDLRLERLAVAVPGLAEGRVGEPPGMEVSRISGYSRSRLIDAVVAAVDAARVAFPRVRLAVEVARITDRISSPPLWFDLVNELRIVFGLTLEVWDENLAASSAGGAPRAAGSYPMTTWARWNGVTGFQMLQSWRNPFYNPSATEDTTPEDAIAYAVNTFDTDYFEVYAADLDHRPWWREFGQRAAAFS